MNQDQGLDGILAEGTEVTGTLTFDDTVRIDGVFRGKIRSDTTLVLGPTADVEAEIEVGELVVHGRLRGRVVARERTTIRATGVVDADLVSGRLSVESGARFNGSCETSAAKGSPERSAPAEAASSGRAGAGAGPGAPATGRGRSAES